MGLKEFSWKTLFTACLNRESPTPKPKLLQDTKPSSSHRFRLSDLSNPGSTDSVYELSNVITNLHIFSLKELKLVTNDFSSGNHLGEGGFGGVFKGFIDDKLRPGLKAQVVAVKTLDLDGSQGHREWLAEVIILGQLKHPHLVNLIGYCWEDEHRLLVYEYLERGSLEKQLFNRYSASLPWLTRLKIATGAAKGLAFLHGEEKPIIYRDFKGSNILLDPDYNAKLSDFGLATDGPDRDQTHITTRVMGTEGYAAPEYIMTGHLTTMSDVFSFGVVLLELLTGRRSLDKKRPSKEQLLVKWARPFLKDPHKLDKIMDPRLEGQYSTEGSRKAAALAYQCLSHHCKSRPTMGNVVKTLEPLLELNDIPVGPFVYIAPMEDENGDNVEKKGKECQNQCDVKKYDSRAEEKNLKMKERGYNRQHHKGHKHRYRIKRMRSQAVYSDTDLYKALGTSLYSPRN